MDYFILFIKTAFILQLIIVLASTCTWFERKVSALIQDRIGANRAGAYFVTDNIFLKPIFFILRITGILGLVNTFFCDPVKAIMKEDFVPEGTSNFMHSLAPFLSVLPVFLAFAVIPLAPDFRLTLDFEPYFSIDQVISMQLAPLNVGVLFLFAMGSMAVYGVIIAGWTSNNKFAVLGSLRAAAQLISYELAMGVAFITIVATYQTMDFYEIIEAQKSVWGVFQNPLAWLTLLILFVVGMAETKRAPFDMPEAESELVAGYFTEYSGMKFLLFWMGEFAEIALFSLVTAVFFLGGWHLPFVQLPDGVLGAVLGFHILLFKVFGLCILQIAIRWSLPRFRYDQLMNLGWKYLLPLSLLNLVATAAWVIWRGGVS